MNAFYYALFIMYRERKDISRPRHTDFCPGHWGLSTPRPCRPHVRHLEQVGMHALQVRVGARHPPVKEVVSPLVGGRERALELSAAIAKHAALAQAQGE